MPCPAENGPAGDAWKLSVQAGALLKRQALRSSCHNDSGREKKMLSQKLFPFFMLGIPFYIPSKVLRLYENLVSVPSIWARSEYVRVCRCADARSGGYRRGGGRGRSVLLEGAPHPGLRSLQYPRYPPSSRQHGVDRLGSQNLNPKPYISASRRHLPILFLPPPSRTCIR